MFVEQIFKMQRLEVSCAVRRIYTSLGAKRLILHLKSDQHETFRTHGQISSKFPGNLNLIHTVGISSGSNL